MIAEFIGGPWSRQVHAVQGLKPELYVAMFEPHLALYPDGEAIPLKPKEGIYRLIAGTYLYVGSR